MIFQEKFFSCYILLADQISVSGCLDITLPALTFVKDLLSCFYWLLKFIVYNDEKRRNQGHIQKPCGLSDKVLCNFLPLLIAAKSFNLKVAEFLDLSLKTSPCTKTVRILCKSQCFLKCGYLYQNSLCCSVALQKQPPKVFFKNRCF